MTAIGLILNLLLVGLLLAALGLGLRLNRRLKALRDSHDGFAVAVRELNTAAERAEQGLADLRAATDEATDALADRLEKGRALAARLERLLAQAPAGLPDPPEEKDAERRLGALLAAAREARARPERLVRREPLAPLAHVSPSADPRGLPDDDLFEEAPLALDRFGGRS